jgi:hypothetical protein
VVEENMDWEYGLGGLGVKNVSRVVGEEVRGLAVVFVIIVGGLVHLEKS